MVRTRASGNRTRRHANTVLAIRSQRRQNPSAQAVPEPAPSPAKQSIQRCSRRIGPGVNVRRIALPYSPRRLIGSAAEG